MVQGIRNSHSANSLVESSSLRNSLPNKESAETLFTFFPRDFFLIKFDLHVMVTFFDPVWPPKKWRDKRVKLDGYSSRKGIVLFKYGHGHLQVFWTWRLLLTQYVWFQIAWASNVGTKLRQNQNLKEHQKFKVLIDKLLGADSSCFLIRDKKYFFLW